MASQAGLVEVAEAYRACTKGWGAKPAISAASFKKGCICQEPIQELEHVKQCFKKVRMIT
jgi:hypothetical protein